MKRKLLMALLIFVATVIAAGLYVKTADSPAPIVNQNSLIGRIGEGYFNFEVASSNAQRTRGLSGRQQLADTDALLFVFEQPAKHCFWMKDMNFSIDILWFNKDKRLVDKRLAVAPETFPDNFCPASDSLYVVEVTSGVADKNQLEIGDRLEVEL